MAELFQIFCLQCGSGLGETTNPIMRIICKNCYPALARRPRRRQVQDREKTAKMIAGVNTNGK